MALAADADPLVAIDIAEWLVSRGVPFREAHALVGSAVRVSLGEGRPLSAVVAEDERLGPEAAALFAHGSSISRRRSAGSTGPAATSEQVLRLDAAMAAARQRVDSD
jgi:argininosuccinate lyase